MTATDAPALYGARPVFTLGGAVDDALSDAVTRLVVEETTAGLTRLEATFGNWGGSEQGDLDFRFFDGRTFDLGTEIAVELGEGRTAGSVFTGRVSALEAQYPQLGGPELAVLAEDELQPIRMTRRTRVFEDVSDADIVSRIAREHGLRARVDLDGPVHRVVAQLNESDLGFVRRRAQAAGGEVTLHDGQLEVQPRERRSATTVTIEEGDLRDCVMTADLADQRSSVTVTGWDVEAKAAVRHRATGTVVSAELGGLRSGPNLVADVFGDRDEQIAHTQAASVSEAQAYAEATMRLLARRFVRGRVLVQGNANLKVGIEVEMSGLGPLFDGTHTVTEVRHAFDAERGFETWFHTERPGLGVAR